MLVSVGACVCARALRIVSKDKILCFKNTLIISISIITSAYSREITLTFLALRSCVKVEVNVLGSPSLCNSTVSVDVKQHLRRRRIFVLVVLHLNVNCLECNCSFCYIRA